MSKTIIAPIVGFIFIAIKMIWGIDFDEDFQQKVIDCITVGAGLAAIGYGIVKNHIKKK
jgi:hypothetical protein